MLHKERSQGQAPAANDRQSGFPRFLHSLVPRTSSKLAFVFTFSAYGIAIGIINAKIIRLIGLWPVMADSEGITRSIQPGLEQGTILRALIGPLIETILLIVVIEGLRKIRTAPIVQILLSAILICILHSTSIPIWGLLVLPTFFFDTAAYVYWRPKSFWVAAQIMYAVHFFCNLQAFLTIVERTFR
jgi:uncharacterized membrane protein YvlD (DUF360 family)